MAVVAVDLIEYRNVEPSPRRFVGRWDLVLTEQGWLMDTPHFWARSWRMTGVQRGAHLKRRRGDGGPLWWP